MLGFDTPRRWRSRDVRVSRSPRSIARGLQCPIRSLTAMHLPRRFCINICLRANHCSFSNRTLIVIHQKKEQTMKTKRLIVAITVSAGLILGPAALAQEETPVDMKDVPSPAQTTIKE